ncbi:hypothetical protein BDFG_05392 [Blastomyces dermatitidis ATCC 26199]|nr:hypothetical protein BDFG_05392 [Blastomyces dermatitidis ATCC 26199]
MTRQSKVIDTLKMDCKELKAGQQILQAQNSDLKEGITTLKTRINQPSWASIAAMGAGEHHPRPPSQRTGTRRTYASGSAQ